MNIYRIGSRGEMVKHIQSALKVYPDGIFGRETEEAVKDFQRKKGICADGIVGAKTLALLLPAVMGLKRSKRTITEIIVHCTATQEGKNYTVADIRRWHKAQGWSDIGYHYVIYRDGHIEPGRDVDIAGAHCSGHNLHSIGVCYVGGVASDGKTPKDTRTIAQKASLTKLLRELQIMYNHAKIYGHRDFANKACPSFNATSEYKYL